MQSSALLNIRSLDPDSDIPESLAEHMTNYKTQFLGLIETRIKHANLPTKIRALGYDIFAPTDPHPPLGGLAIIYNDQWTPIPARSKYTRSDICHAERLLLVFENIDSNTPSIAIMLAYFPPSTTLRGFKSFLTHMFADIATLQASSDIETIVLTDANAN